MVHKAKYLYKQYRNNTYQAQKKLGAEDFDTIFNEHIPIRDDEVKFTFDIQKKLISNLKKQKYFKEKKNNKVKQMLENANEKNYNENLEKSEKIYQTYCQKDPTTLNNAMDVLKERYFGAFEMQEKKISKKFDRIFENTNKIDHLVNNVKCKNSKINNQLKPMIQNMFVVYQREIIEQIIDDILLEEVCIYIFKIKIR